MSRKLGIRTMASPRLGFSLIELLVVIVIVAIIAGMLLPVLASVKSAAQSATCANQLRQLGLSTTSYVVDSDGLLPMTQPWSDGRAWSYWDAPLMDLLDVPRTYTIGYWMWKQDKSPIACPAQPNTKFAAYPALPSRRYYSYTINSHYCDAGTITMNRVVRISEKVLFCDAGTLTTPYINIWAAAYGSPTNIFATRHRQRGNTLFFDGHVEARTTQSLAAINFDRNP